MCSERAKYHLHIFSQREGKEFGVLESFATLGRFGLRKNSGVLGCLPREGKARQQGVTVSAAYSLVVVTAAYGTSAASCYVPLRDTNAVER